MICGDMGKNLDRQRTFFGVRLDLCLVNPVALVRLHRTKKISVARKKNENWEPVPEKSVFANFSNTEMHKSWHRYNI